MIFNRNMFSIGLSLLGSKNNKYSTSEQIKKVIDVIDFGVNKVDTADSYASTNSERYLSQILDLRPDVLVTTKVGGFLSNLPIPINEILINSRMYQKAQIIRNGGYFDFNPKIKPLDLEKNLIKSLRRLGVEHVNCYLLHGVPSLNLIDDFVNQMLILKEKGLTSNVGISIEKRMDIDLSWCDEVLIPAHLLEFYELLNAKVSIHGLFRKELRISENVGKRFLQLSSAGSVLMGSLNLNKYIEAEKILRHS
jgi:aryl-alcohol dehydrogenase-like predicted oxidoreductase